MLHFPGTHTYTHTQTSKISNNCGVTINFGFSFWEANMLVPYNKVSRQAREDEKMLFRYNNQLYADDDCT